MESIQLGPDGPTSSRLAYGCMRIAGDGSAAARARGKRAVQAAIDAGYTLFDHADIYGGGACEEIFGEILRENPGLRDQVLLQGKCSVRFAGTPEDDSPQRYDLSAAHITRGVEGTLRRLGVDHLDLFLLHRPDFLMDATEIAEAFAALQASGRVARFGVSNFTPSQVDLLQSVLPAPLLVNQIEINLHRIAALSDGTLDQCQRTGMTPQAWCPLGGVAYDAWGNTLSAADAERLQKELAAQSAHYGAPDWVVALAWLLRHPAQISPIVGSTTPERIGAALQALELEYTRDSWYRLLEARVGSAVP